MISLLESSDSESNLVGSVVFLLSQHCWSWQSHAQCGRCRWAQSCQSMNSQSFVQASSQHSLYGQLVEDSSLTHRNLHMVVAMFWLVHWILVSDYKNTYHDIPSCFGHIEHNSEPRHRLLTSLTSSSKKCPWLPRNFHSLHLQKNSSFPPTFPPTVLVAFLEVTSFPGTIVSIAQCNPRHVAITTPGLRWPSWMGLVWVQYVDHSTSCYYISYYWYIVLLIYYISCDIYIYIHLYTHIYPWYITLT